MGDTAYDLQNVTTLLNDDYGISNIHHLAYGEEMQIRK